MERNKFRPRPSQELCPFEVVEWEKLKTTWNCTDPADYHCLPDQYNVPGQICVKPHWVLKNYCPIYNTAAAKIDLLPCDLQYGACSDKDYRSNEVFRYTACLNKTEIYKEGWRLSSTATSSRSKQCSCWSTEGDGVHKEWCVLLKYFLRTCYRCVGHPWLCQSHWTAWLR
uniref:Uncharacterized protein LOC111130705 n=1 Tax=Crassostrea virginica TaxID=6565 RepID=A0A8B8DZC0_CRAVI|nr:uncharacterized protein LOC111130705 [Crassostrea virginica]